MSDMRIQHKPKGTPPWCSQCGAPFRKHRQSDRKAWTAARDAKRPVKHVTDNIIGIDGEGQGRTPHLYTYLAAANAKRTWSVENDSGLTTEQCLKFIHGLPNHALIVGYAFGYDLTKILADLPDDLLYSLTHEETRARLKRQRIVYVPIEWRSPDGTLFKINYMNRKFTVTVGTKSITVWDVFRFFQGKFTQALIDWKIADKERLSWMESMKDRRSQFDQLSKAEVQAYCKEECQYMARLTQELIDAHNAAELPLTSYYGAGSTASAFLKKISIKEKRGEFPEAMRKAIASAFFGGRFENSVVGPIPGLVYNYDISSAYPYHAYQLPCLKHGQWSHTKRHCDVAIGDSQLALIRWRIPQSNDFEKQNLTWGPFPVRSQIGTIAFPLAGKGGWVWKPEYIAAREHFDVHVSECWVYNTDCDCHPFASIPATYRERLKLGKDARGIVLKLGLNSIYGKLAQSAGISPPYQSWIWAGNITSGCRAQLLEAVYAAKDTRNVLMLATDGVWTRDRLSLPLPLDTGTANTGKPLGGWEEKTFESGVFAVRPGIYFPLNPTETQLKEVRARGLGKRTLYEQWPKIVEAWEKGDEFIDLDGMTRFVGMKSALTMSAKGVKRSPQYGEWIPHAITVNFDPAPKRAEIRGQYLTPHQYFDWESEPYDKAVASPEALMLALQLLQLEEQPNGDWSQE